MRRDPGLTVSFEALPEWQVIRRYGVRVVAPERAVFDEMRRHDQREALVVLESALAGWEPDDIAEFERLLGKFVSGVNSQTSKDPS